MDAIDPRYIVHRFDSFAGDGMWLGTADAPWNQWNGLGFEFSNANPTSRFPMPTGIP